ncbi:hypothetical protein ACH4C6_36040 [Streptomyces sp. NPDC017943]|uniref:hypothetical protein n=1 Tax=Streptomyces sp. NPDC017943 TaxID=3365019 RepID=UPI0037BD7BBF
MQHGSPREHEARDSSPLIGLPLPHEAVLADLKRAARTLSDLTSSLTVDRSSDETIGVYRDVRLIADWAAAVSACHLMTSSDEEKADQAWASLAPGEMSHALLVAVLMNLGGAHTLPASSITPDVIAGRDGALHAAVMEQLPDSTVRISVAPRPPDAASGMTVELG